MWLDLGFEIQTNVLLIEAYAYYKDLVMPGHRMRPTGRKELVETENNSCCSSREFTKSPGGIFFVGHSVC